PLPSAPTGRPSASPTPLAPSKAPEQRATRGLGGGTAGPRDSGDVPLRGRPVAPSSSPRAEPSEHPMSALPTPDAIRRP
ncbi:hypothetical protein KN815_44930, partial [Streptomyces sp. 4503]|nr:hypothetical protein [Streptomyces niphimycinicus]